MGMYTELHFNATIESKHKNRSAIEVLQFIFKKDPEEDARKNFLRNKGLDHPWFESDRWDWMFFCDSYYFDGDTSSSFRYDEIGRHWVLSVRCNLKNYTQEIQHFIDWIDPFLDKEEGDFLGFYRYEEDETPTLIHKK